MLFYWKIGGGLLFLGHPVERVRSCCVACVRVLLSYLCRVLPAPCCLTCSVCRQCRSIILFHAFSDFTAWKAEKKLSRSFYESCFGPWLGFNGTRGKNGSVESCALLIRLISVYTDIVSLKRLRFGNTIVKVYITFTTSPLYCSLL